MTSTKKNRKQRRAEAAGAPVANRNNDDAADDAPKLPQVRMGDDVPLPLGFAMKALDDDVSMTNKHRDLGDIFSLGFLGLVVVLFASGIGAKLFDLPGFIGALALTAPLWGWLAFSALRRAVNTTTVHVTPGHISVRVGPIGKVGSKELGEDDVGAAGGFHVKNFENRSTTRGGKLVITKTWSLWVKAKDAGDLCLAEPLDDETQARMLEKRMTTAFRRTKAK